MSPRWNHNNHYHSVLLNSLPERCHRALDVGCGDGDFARKLASRAVVVDAIDQSGEMIQQAKALSHDVTNLTFIPGDFMKHPLEPNTYNFVSGIAVLHHLPFVGALEKMKAALKPRGVLAILGLFKERLPDLPRSVIAVFVNQVYLRIRDTGDPSIERQPPVTDATMSLREIKSAAAQLLPGARFQTHLLWRYSLLWQKP